MATVLAASKSDLGVSVTAKTVFEDVELKQAILKMILSSAHQELKKSLKESQLCKDKEKSTRDYLLSITPASLCLEFRENSPQAFQLLVGGLIGVNDLEAIPENKHLSNNIALLYSTISKLNNRKATGYAMVQTAAVRDGGLREDSIKLFSNFCHPRTMQKYDKEVLAKDWDSKLKIALGEEANHFEELSSAEDKLECAIQEGESAAEVKEAKTRLPGAVPQPIGLFLFCIEFGYCSVYESSS